MKKLILTLAVLLQAAVSFAQTPEATKEEPKEEGFVFKTVKEVPITSIKDQHRSGTCWAFSTMGFFEAEVLREKGINVDLAEMYLVSLSGQERGDLFVRLHGNATFAAGGAFADGLACLLSHGLVPQSAMPGINYAQSEGDTLPNHGEFDKVTDAFIKAIAKSGSSRLTPAWKRAFKDIYDEYLGQCPEEFTYEGVKYTPRTFADNYLGLKADDYISLTSFTHHPFYAPFALEIEDNWRHAESYNLPIDELMEVMRYAINNGYTIAWGSDVSEQGFTRNGIAVMPDSKKGAAELGSDMAHWLGLSKTSQREQLTSKPLPEIEVTQEMRQQAFDNWETTDDHGMVIYGIAQDQNGKPYFLVKNSWGDAGKYHGIWYASEAFVKYKTMNIVINKKALPKAIAKKLGIK